MSTETATAAISTYAPDHRRIDTARAAVVENGYATACARAAFLLACNGVPLPLSWLTLKGDLVKDYSELLPAVTPAQWRSILQIQETIVRNTPEYALSTLPELLPDCADRANLLALLARLLVDQRVQNVLPLPAQRAMLLHLRQVLDTDRVLPDALLTDVKRAVAAST